MFIDTPIFAIDLLYPWDVNYQVNRRFIELQIRPRYTSIINVLETCGLASFNLTGRELDKLFYGFSHKYDVQILWPTGIEDMSPTQAIRSIIAQIYSHITQKMSFADALILSIAESHGLSTFITWNKRHFEGKTAMQVFTPAEYLAEQLKTRR